MFTLSCLLFALIAGVLNVRETSGSHGEGATPGAPVEVSDGILHATCEMNPSTRLPPGQPKIHGQVLFKQVNPGDKLQIVVNLHGFPTEDDVERAIHIHQYGDLSEGCSSAGPHFNPLGQDHPEHPGDLGNFNSSHGQVGTLLTSHATLFGSQSVLGRSVVLHERTDDMGQGGDEESLRSGNAGVRIACCVIGVSGSSLWKNALQPDKSSDE